MTAQPHATARRSARMGGFAIYAAAVISVVMALFPPHTSPAGVEYAFVATGPEWSRQLSPVAESLGITPRIHWSALLVQYAAVWALALGSARFRSGPPLRAMRHDIESQGRN
jgi:hypothetical protein